MGLVLAGNHLQKAYSAVLGRQDLPRRRGLESCQQVSLHLGHVQALLLDLLTKDFHGIGGVLAVWHRIPNDGEEILHII